MSRSPPEPRVDGDVIHLPGGGPVCPGCDGPTYSVTGDADAQRPWWCPDCSVRLSDGGDYGAAASFPSGADPDP